MDSVLDILKTSWDYLSHPLFEISGNQISLISLSLCLILFFVSLKLGTITEKIIHRILDEKQIDSGVKGSISRFTKYGVIMVGALIALDTVGVSLKSLAALGAVLMVGIGFGLQNIAQNFISGLIILLERPIKIGDVVKVKGVSGIVKEIGARSTLIHTRDDVAIIVPNSQFITEQVINESFSGEKIRLHLSVGVAYGSDIKKVKEILLNMAFEHPQVMSEPAPTVLFKEFADSSLNFELRIWVKELWKYDMILSDLRFSISEEFDKMKISIPFPQRDLHIKSSDINFGKN